ncbi:MAG: putative DNA ligase [Candidatus Beckwithbacteria bacterium GW2011_GWA2_43_10]|uniref:DNA ligase (ATP) n=1 Tax=Candidatus Beckwithbacteria bacterium GW2011_GWA2_43_10 TaxID=1618369 RepID=A0A0G1C4D1_9BACT|nr:MAG: putative DNA ligase [Candidatus Beckwithbacteria bacterium GW2011_GWA2_43_10]
MKFSRLAEYFVKIEKTASRLEMTGLLAELFKEISQEEIDLTVYLSLGRLRPKFEGVEFNLAEKMMLRAIGVAYHVNLSIVTNEFKKRGNLGEVVQCLVNQRLASRKNLSVAQVYQRLWDIAVDEGQGSQERKVNNMAKLIQDLNNLSAQFVVRIPINNLRLGFSEMTVLDGLSWMAKDDKSLRPELERAFNLCADIGEIAKVFKESGLAGISGIKAKIGVPIRPAKSERLPSAAKIVEKLEVFGVEGKWDGLRVQIHLDKIRNSKHEIRKSLFEEKPQSFVRIFSRNLDNMTAMFPDIAKACENLAVKSVILDGEAMASDPKTGKLLAFQETVQRKRVHGIGQKAEEMPMKVFVYDILLLDGESLIEKTFRERRKALEKIFSKNNSSTLNLAEQEIVSDVKRLKELMTEYLKMGLEGVMCKKLTTSYQAGARNFNWVKLKKATEGDLTDTIDCVVMGYYAGKGKRTGFGVGAFLVGVMDEKGKIGSIAKIGTGLTDEQWKELKARSTKLEIRNKPEEYIVDKNLEPDVWVRPELVVEILADEITQSPIHSFGLALRFPRLVNFRDDKNVSEATTRQELEKMFRLQGK